MRVYRSETLFRDKRVRCFECKPFEPLLTSVTLSAADGLIMQTKHVEHIGFRQEEMVVARKNCGADVCLSKA